MAPDVPQVPRLTPAQIALFKQQGFLVMPSVLDPALLTAADDALWDILAEHMPRLDRGHPSTWTTFVGDEQILRRKDQQKSHEGGDKIFECNGSRFYTRNGADEPLLNCLPRALWSLAEQMLGESEITWPAGVNERDEISGPTYMDVGVQGGMKTHCDIDPSGAPLNRTDELALPRTGPGWLNGQGCEGHYVTMPKSVGLGRHAEGSGDGLWQGAHCDGLNNRVRLKAIAFITDCPPGCGGFTIWPRSHVPLWERHWAALADGKTPDGYLDEVMDEVKKVEPVECFGKAGTVVLWHGTIAHVVGANHLSTHMRNAAIYGFHKTPDALPDTEIQRRNSGEEQIDIWEDWSAEVKEVVAPAVEVSALERSQQVRHNAGVWVSDAKM